jgi:hypothetical protein
MSDKITTHVVQAIARLAYQFEDSENFQNLISVFATRTQQIENVLDELITDRWTDTAEGTQLDELGLIVGQCRGGCSDSCFKDAILIKIYLNATHGEPEAIIAAVKAITKADTVCLSEVPVATVIITGNGELAPIHIGEFLGDLTPAGVKLYFISTYGEVPLAFADDGTFNIYSDPPVGLGFAESDGAGGILTEQGQITEVFN